MELLPTRVELSDETDETAARIVREHELLIVDRDRGTFNHRSRVAPSPTIQEVVFTD